MVFLPWLGWILQRITQIFKHLIFQKKARSDNHFSCPKMERSQEIKYKENKRSAELWIQQKENYPWVIGIRDFSVNAKDFTKLNRYIKRRRDSHTGALK